MSSSLISELTAQYSSAFDYNKKETVIILAAGHGKRIKSNTSKMLHKIWEIPTVERVYNACTKAFDNANVILVVGIKAEDVIKTIGKKNNLVYVYQETQNGTGHAVQVALQNVDQSKYDGTVYIIPGDMGLINEATLLMFKEEFFRSNSDMMVLTGQYEGPHENNYYGRIVRVGNKDSKGKSSGKDKDNVIEIIEYKDIMNLDSKKPYKVKHNKKEYLFKKKELIENREFNSGVFAFSFKPLAEQITKISNDNVQNEIYLTDLIFLFNQNCYKVSAVSPKEQYVLMGFNNKSVLKEMDTIARKLAYEKLKDIIMIDDPDDFFIDENVIEEIIEMDKLGVPLDIKIGKGVYIGNGVKLNSNLALMKNVHLHGNIIFGINVCVRGNVQMSCFYGQKIFIGDNVEIFNGDIIKGNVTIGENSVIESQVRITGSDEYPVQIGKHVTIKGVSYIFGSVIDNNFIIEHSVLKCKNVARPEESKSEISKVKYYLPEAEGIETINNLL
ncbi:MAG: NTP transferase domain-containing protein [Bacteroidota bacterium]